MPALSRIISNTVKSDGTILTVASVTAVNDKAAKTKGLNAALRHNGYSDAILNRQNLSAEVMDVSYERKIGLRVTYLVKTKITGATSVL